MTLRKAVFAVPGDPATRTGGYIYDARVLAALRDTGRQVDALRLPDGFPMPDSATMALALSQLQAVDPDVAIIIDGLALGALDPVGMANVSAPVVAMIHHPLARETGLRPEEVDHFARVEAANLSRAAHVIVPSPHTAKVLVQDYGVPQDRLTIASPGIDKPTGKPAPSQPPLILSVGILAPRKGHDILLRALAELNGQDWEAVIVGKSHDMVTGPALHSMASELGLNDRVTFAGEMAPEDLAVLFQRASVFALATLYEGYGMVFAEALVHGLPIVTCRTGAVPDTVPAEAGTLVAPGDPSAFASALGAVLRDHDLRERQAAAAARHGASLPNWEDTAALFGHVLDQLGTA
ncbi:glycosyltransferase family 4 protein [Meridianimarinicoccus aquatilis]|uniref:Glycosyltransferase family 1 protein n=1 Tax=Meridianimarinicoccus aquatilis TaxID=2552766 RepID=A0A4R6ARJ1_9RHOB|nr:glycosyltransferase family 4 protein [Fluviibacterium aquatile]TDL84706.1 glycosyltransferase family 1 protein [Fluviibacterium aquatile]